MCKLLAFISCLLFKINSIISLTELQIRSRLNSKFHVEATETLQQQQKHSNTWVPLDRVGIASILIFYNKNTNTNAVESMPLGLRSLVRWCKFSKNSFNCESDDQMFYDSDEINADLKIQLKFLIFKFIIGGLPIWWKASQGSVCITPVNARYLGWSPGVLYCDWRKERCLEIKVIGFAPIRLNALQRWTTRFFGKSILQEVVHFIKIDQIEICECWMLEAGNAASRDIKLNNDRIFMQSNNNSCCNKALHCRVTGTSCAKKEREVLSIVFTSLPDFLNFNLFFSLLATHYAEDLC